MVIVEIIALSTMVSNDLVLPVLLRRWHRRPEAWIWAGCCSSSAAAPSSLILLLGYLYYRLAGEAYALVGIGLISFAAVAQFAPAVFAGALLARRHPRGGAGRALGGLPGVDLYPAAALLRPLRLAAARVHGVRASSASIS